MQCAGVSPEFCQSNRSVDGCKFKTGCRLVSSQKGKTEEIVDKVKITIKDENLLTGVLPGCQMSFFPVYSFGALWILVVPRVSATRMLQTIAHCS